VGHAQTGARAAEIHNHCVAQIKLQDIHIFSFFPLADRTHRYTRDREEDQHREEDQDSRDSQDSLDSLDSRDSKDTTSDTKNVTAKEGTKHKPFV